MPSTLRRCDAVTCRPSSEPRFLTRDPLTAATRSPYGYVHGNPLNFTDPTGMCFASFCDDWGDDVNNAWDNTAGKVVSAVSDHLPHCFTWQDGCQSYASQLTGGRYCSRLFEEGCTKPIGELRAQVCVAYGCVAVTYDGSFHHHEALGMGFDASIGFSPSVSSCDAHDEAFGSLGPVGVSSTRSDPEGSWSSPSPSVSLSLKFGFGLVHWFD